MPGLGCTWTVMLLLVCTVGPSAVNGKTIARRDVSGEAVDELSEHYICIQHIRGRGMMSNNSYCTWWESTGT